MLPEKTVERLSQYRRTLLKCLSMGKTHIYSHELAELQNITAVQVRRDIMFLGFSSAQRKGYDVKEMIDMIGKVIDSDEVLNLAVVGMGNLGTAVTHYFIGKRPSLNIVASFDISSERCGNVILGVECFHMDDLPRIIKERNITIGMLTVPPEVASETAQKLMDAGIKGILNFTTVPLNVSPKVYLEEYDMITSLEKVAYFVKKQGR
jgi:redox-sensing transcriptional repressor